MNGEAMQGFDSFQRLITSTTIIQSYRTRRRVRASVKDETFGRKVEAKHLTLQAILVLALSDEPNSTRGARTQAL